MLHSKKFCQGIDMLSSLVMILIFAFGIYFAINLGKILDYKMNPNEAEKCLKRLRVFLWVVVAVVILDALMHGLRFWSN
jgi:hypothetical protein